MTINFNAQRSAYEIKTREMMTEWASIAQKGFANGPLEVMIARFWVENYAYAFSAERVTRHLNNHINAAGWVFTDEQVEKVLKRMRSLGYLRSKKADFGERRLLWEVKY